MIILNACREKKLKTEKNFFKYHRSKVLVVKVY